MEGFGPLILILGVAIIIGLFIFLSSFSDTSKHPIKNSSGGPSRKSTPKIRLKNNYEALGDAFYDETQKKWGFLGWKTKIWSGGDEERFVGMELLKKDAAIAPYFDEIWNNEERLKEILGFELVSVDFPQPVKKEGKWGLLGWQGEWVTDLEFDYIGEEDGEKRLWRKDLLDREFCKVRKGEQCYYVNDKGQTITPKVSESEVFSSAPNIKKLQANKDLNGLIQALNYRISTGKEFVKWERVFFEELIEALGDMRNSQAVKPLTNFLKRIFNTDDSYLATNVSAAMRKIGGKEAFEYLIFLISRCAHPEIWNDAEIFWRSSNDPSLIEPFIRGLKHPGSRIFVIQEIRFGKMKDTRFIEPLLEGIREKEWEPEDTKDAVLAIQSQGKDLEVREAAIQAFQELNEHPSLSGDDYRYSYSCTTIRETLADWKWEKKS